MKHKRDQKTVPAKSSRYRLLLAAILLIPILVLVGSLKGCAYFLAYAIVSAPNRGRPIISADDPPPHRLAALGVDHQIRVEVGPPLASLSLWVIEPKEGVDRKGGGAPGAILLLHGIRSNKDSFIGLGKILAAAGFCAVLVDLRGHGRSSGDWLTYGAVERHDLSQLIDELATRGLAGEGIGVLGTSYGGAIAIQFAALDPRVLAVVAVSPFTSLEEVVPGYVKHYLLSWLITDGWIKEALIRAGKMAGFNPKTVNPLDAIGKTQAPILLIHGEEDSKIPCWHSEILHKAAENRSRFILLENEDHDSIMADRSGIIASQSVNWFKRWLD